MSSANTRQTTCGQAGTAEITGQNDSKKPSPKVTVKEFLDQIGLAECLEIFSGYSSEELILMSRVDLRSKMKSRPHREVMPLNEGICNLRQCLFPFGQQELPEDFPDLKTYLEKNGVSSYAIGDLKKRKVDMKEFLNWPESDWWEIGFQADVDVLSDCRHSLFTLLLKKAANQGNNGRNPGPEMEDEKVRELKLFLDSISMGDHLSKFLRNNMELSAALTASEDKLRSIGMKDFEVAHFNMKKGISQKRSSTFQNQNARNTESSAGVIKKSSVPSQPCSGPQHPFEEEFVRPPGCSNGRGRRLVTDSSTSPTSSTEVSSLSRPAQSSTTGNDAKISTEAFLHRHGFPSPQQAIPEGSEIYMKDLSEMGEPELRRLAQILLETNRELSKVAIRETEAQTKLPSGSSCSTATPHALLDSGDVEMTDISASAQAVGTESSETIPSEPTHRGQNDKSGPGSVSTSAISKMHAYQQLPPESVQFIPRPAINILLLGETGVGKSTFINAFANYVNYETLGEARGKDLIVVIPAIFSVSDDNYVDHKVIIEAKSASVNESLEQKGQSSTQSCKSYVFPSRNGAIRIIDTPGVGDTRGLDQDSLNFENILCYISQFPELHAICILLKPNNAKLTAGFRLCVNQLLSNLEKTASRNIIFIFTNARSTFYQPGDTKPVLDKVLQEISGSPPYIKIQFDLSTSYCVDNEAFRFLAAVSNGLDFLEGDFNTFESSWTTSVQECKRLMEYILTLQPHQIRDTVSISQARRLIDELGDPVADILLEIAMNLSRFEEHIDCLRSNTGTKDLESLKGKLKSKVMKMCYRNLPQPRTVCASERCITYYDGSIQYPQICHDRCYLTDPASERIGDPSLKSCLAFGISGTCRDCKCSWKNHMRITREKIIMEVEEEDSSVKALLRKAATIGEVIQALQSNVEQYRKERKLLVDTMAFFTVFQSVNSITGRGDPFRDALQDHLRIENYKSSLGVKNGKVIRSLDLCMHDYDATKSKLISGNEAHESRMMMIPENIFKYEQVIYDLKIHGSRLRELHETSQNGRVKDLVSSSEEVVDFQEVGRATTSILQPVDSYFANW